MWLRRLANHESQNLKNLESMLLQDFTNWCVWFHSLYIKKDCQRHSCFGQNYDWYSKDQTALQEGHWEVSGHKGNVFHKLVQKLAVRPRSRALGTLASVHKQPSSRIHLQTCLRAVEARVPNSHPSTPNQCQSTSVFFCDPSPGLASCLDVQKLLVHFLGPKSPKSPSFQCISFSL